MQKKSSGFIQILLILVVIIVVAVFVIGKNKLGSVVTVGSPVATQISVPVDVDTTGWKVYKDPNLSKFSVKYDPSKWEIGRSYDEKACGDVSCGPSYGRGVDFISKKYGDKLVVRIGLDKVSDEVVTGGVCFGLEDIVDIGNGWYRATNPYESVNVQDMNKTWDRFYYMKSSVFDNNGKKCLAGSLNVYKQLPLPAIYQGANTVIIAELLNRVSVDLSNSGDGIINSISFQ